MICGFPRLLAEFMQLAERRRLGGLGRGRGVGVIRQRPFLTPVQ